jgi:hypothetical protein
METQMRDKQHLFTRLEDSFSLHENQKRFPEDPAVESENNRLAAIWHEKMVKCRKLEKELDIKIC